MSEAWMQQSFIGMRSAGCMNYETVKRPSVRPSVRSAVCPIVRQLLLCAAAASLLLGSSRTGDIDRWTGSQQQRWRSTALSSKCEQCHVGSRGTKQ